MSESVSQSVCQSVRRSLSLKALILINGDSCHWKTSKHSRNIYSSQLDWDYWETTAGFGERGKTIALGIGKSSKNNREAREGLQSKDRSFRETGNMFIAQGYIQTFTPFFDILIYFSWLLYQWMNPLDGRSLWGYFVSHWLLIINCMQTLRALLTALDDLFASFWLLSDFCEVVKFLFTYDSRKLRHTQYWLVSWSFCWNKIHQKVVMKISKGFPNKQKSLIKAHHQESPKAR